LFFLGLFPGSIAYLIVALLINKYKMSSFASYLFLIPFIAVFTGYIFLKEVPALVSFLGGLVIIVGVLIKNKVLKLGNPSPDTLKT
jgi:drug/metabolite transporter (DMT)-like permease